MIEFAMFLIAFLVFAGSFYALDRSLDLAGKLMIFAILLLVIAKTIYDFNNPPNPLDLDLVLNYDLLEPDTDYHIY